MKNPYQPHPPIEAIEQRLFGITEVLIDAVERGEVSESLARVVRASPEWAERSLPAPTETETATFSVAPIPAAISDLISRRVAARSAFSNTGSPAAGQIAMVRQIVTPRPKQLDAYMQAPLFVLLDVQAEAPSIWHGWLATGETDYAGYWDFVLQECDLPFDPQAAMVQVWNPVRVRSAMLDRVVAQLTPARLQAVRALAAEFATSTESPAAPVWPGHVARRETLGGLSAVTGSPLGDGEDPRHRYQHMYFHAAEALRIPARLELQELAESESAARQTPGLLQRLLERAHEMGEALTAVPLYQAAMKKNAPPSGADASYSIDLYLMNFESVASYSADLPSDANEPDRILNWAGLAQIQIAETKADGAGCLLIQATGGHALTAAIAVSGVTEQRIAVLPDADPETLCWDAVPETWLILESARGERLEIPLIE